MAHEGGKRKEQGAARDEQAPRAQSRAFEHRKDDKHAKSGVEPADRQNVDEAGVTEERFGLLIHEETVADEHRAEHRARLPRRPDGAVERVSGVNACGVDHTARRPTPRRDQPQEPRVFHPSGRVEPLGGEASSRAVLGDPGSRHRSAQAAPHANDVTAPQIGDATSVVSWNVNDVEAHAERRRGPLGNGFDLEGPTALAIPLGSGDDAGDDFELPHRAGAERGVESASGVPPRPSLGGGAQREGRRSDERDRDRRAPPHEESDDQGDARQEPGRSGRGARSSARRAGDERSRDPNDGRGTV